MIIVGVFIWLAFALVVGNVAHNRERSGAEWFILACIISPLLAAVLLALFPDLKRDRLEREWREAMLNAVGGTPTPAAATPTYKPATSNPKIGAALSAAAFALFMAMVIFAH